MDRTLPFHFPALLPQAPDIRLFDTELANCFVNYAIAISRQDGSTLIPRLPAPPGIADNRGEDTAMAMQHARFISAKRRAVAAISIFAPVPILPTDGTGDDGRSTSIIDMPRLLMLVLLGIS